MRWWYWLAGICLVQMIDCRSFNNSNLIDDCNFEDASGIDTYYAVGRWSYILIGPFSMLMTGIIVLSFFVVKDARKPPGDYIFAMSLSNLLETFLLFIMGIQYQIEGGYPEDNTRFCQVTGSIMVTFTVVQFGYYIMFSLTLLIMVTRFSKRQHQINIISHIVIIGSALGYFVDVYYVGSIGLNLFGICSNKQIVRVAIFDIGLLALYISITTYVYFVLRRTLPKDTTLKSSSKSFLNQYLKFILIQLIIWSTLIVCNMIASINCETNFAKPKLSLFVSISNITKISQPIILSYFRMKDGVMEHHVKQAKRKIFRFLGLNQQRIDRSPANQQQMSLPSLDNSSQNIFLYLQQQMQTRRICTLVASVKLSVKQFLNNDLEFFSNAPPESRHSSQNSVRVKSKTVGSEAPQQLQFRKHKEPLHNLDEDLYFSMDNKILRSEFAEVDQSQIQCLEMDVQVHCPLTFSKILNNDGFIEDLEQSFNVLENYNKISKQDAPSGGKSGEFFFFTYDNKYFLKTMKSEEVKSIKARVQDFLEYFCKHPDSLIAKILGIYTFTSKDKNEQINILVMRNLARYQNQKMISLPRKYVLRVYDLKGSNYDREVLKPDDAITTSIVKTLKDRDFEKLEERVNILVNYSERVKLQLFKDVSFLTKHRLIDYSLLIIKADWDSYSDTLGGSKNFGQNDLSAIQSTKEYCYYHIGIIDYLQEWNVNKQMEKVSKIIINLNPNLDTSSQNPDVYGQRFIKNIIDRYF